MISLRQALKKYKNQERVRYKNKWERGGDIKERIPNTNPIFSGIVTGFTMGEGSFIVCITESKTHYTGYQVMPCFKISLKKDDYKILEQIRDYLRCGKVVKFRDTATFLVRKLDEIVEVIIPFFDKYPLQNIKQHDFLLFKIICYKLLSGEGKTIDGIRRIYEIRKHMNNGGHKNRKKISF